MCKNWHWKTGVTNDEHHAPKTKFQHADVLTNKSNQTQWLVFKNCSKNTVSFTIKCTHHFVMILSKTKRYLWCIFLVYFYVIFLQHTESIWQTLQQSFSHVLSGVTQLKGCSTDLWPAWRGMRRWGSPKGSYHIKSEFSTLLIKTSYRLMFLKAIMSQVFFRCI